MNLRYTLSFLRILKIPGLYPLMKDWQASIRIHFIFAAYESGLLKALSQPSSRRTRTSPYRHDKPGPNRERRTTPDNQSIETRPWQIRLRPQTPTRQGRGIQTHRAHR